MKILVTEPISKRVSGVIARAGRPLRPDAECPAQIRWLVAAAHEDSGTSHRTRDRHGPNGQRQPRSVSTPLTWCLERVVPALLYDAPRASVQPDAD